MTLKLNSRLRGRKKEYITLCYYRIDRWRKFVESESVIEDAEAVKPKHIKQYILFAQNRGLEKAITINNSLATLKVFFNYLVEEEFIDEMANPMRKIKSLKEDKRVITTFNDAEVSRILQDDKKKHIAMLEIN